ncbi:DUF996 domain-containing protein [bacterium]|nr:DUF996 domain-containing protein [bacterium]
MEEAKEIDVRSAKLLGGIGSIFLILYPIVGYILLLISAKKFSDLFERPSIFKDFLIATIISAVAAVLVPIIFFPIYLSVPYYSPMESNTNFLFPVLFFLLCILIWVINIVASYFARRGLLSLSEETNRRDFATAGNLIFYGALATIVLVGIIVYLIGAIYAIIAFFSLPDRLPRESTEEVY